MFAQTSDIGRARNLQGVSQAQCREVGEGERVNRWRRA
jgi:hypothetical protein